MTTAELLEGGLTRAGIAARLRSGDFVAISRGVYGSAAVVRQVKQERSGELLLQAAAALATTGPGAVLSHYTAAQIHRLDLLDRAPALVTITRLPGVTRSAKAGVQVRCARLPADHLTQRLGVPVTTAARTVVDLARSMSFEAGVVVADSSLRRKRTTKDELRAVLEDCARWPGASRAAAVIEFADRRAESALESIARVVFRDQGLPVPELQAWLGGDEPVGRVDFYWRKFRTIAEVDGAMKYAIEGQASWRARAQLRRDAYLREAGFEVVHFDWNDITTEPERVAAAIRTAFERARRTGSSPDRTRQGLAAQAGSVA
jgi:very-short-patch-repair endonuclease